MTSNFKTSVEIFIPAEELPDLATLQAIDGSDSANKFIVNALNYFVPYFGEKLLFRAPSEDSRNKSAVKLTFSGDAALALQSLCADMKLKSPEILCWSAMETYLAYMSDEEPFDFAGPAEPEDDWQPAATSGPVPRLH
jgi:hypothetical protein